MESPWLPNPRRLNAILGLPRSIVLPTMRNTDISGNKLLRRALHPSPAAAVRLEATKQPVHEHEGVYAKAKPSVLSGEPIPVRPLEVMAPRVLRKLGVPVRPSRLTRAYNEGRSLQLPAGIVLNVGNRRISRKLGFKGKVVQYERA